MTASREICVFWFFSPFVPESRMREICNVCLFSHFHLAALGLHWNYPGCLVGEDRDNGEEDGNEDGSEELQDAFGDASYDRQSDVHVCKACRMVHFRIQLLLNSLSYDYTTCNHWALCIVEYIIWLLFHKQIQIVFALKLSNSHITHTYTHHTHTHTHIITTQRFFPPIFFGPVFRSGFSSWSPLAGLRVLWRPWPSRTRF